MKKTHIDLTNNVMPRSRIELRQKLRDLNAELTMFQTNASILPSDQFWLNFENYIDQMNLLFDSINDPTSFNIDMANWKLLNDTMLEYCLD